VLLVHGGLHEPMSAARFWTNPGVTDALIVAGHRVIVPDRRWSEGATEAPVVPHTWMLEGEDLAAVLRHAGTGPALVMAGSNGCSAALRLAIDASDLVAGLVLAWPVGPRDRHLEAAFERSAAFVASQGVGAYLDELRCGVPGWASKRPGLAFGVAITTDRTARASFALLTSGGAASLIGRSAASLFSGETVRGVSDEELRGLPRRDKGRRHPARERRPVPHPCGRGWPGRPGRRAATRRRVPRVAVTGVPGGAGPLRLRTARAARRRHPADGASLAQRLTSGDGEEG
jgi:pimeloyl-ACP methyl ester carboxylesterase